MKRIIAILLSCILLLTGCGVNKTGKNQANNTDFETDKNTLISKFDFSSLDDTNLLDYVEDSVYEKLVYDLSNKEYFVENITAKYISKEYLDELEYNSQSNIFFGYTLEELYSQFQGEKYIFTLGEDGTTIAKEFETYDDTYDKVIKNVAIGTGVILLCVTVSALTGGAAPAVSVVFAASAKTGTVVALSDAAISGVISGVITGIETKDFEQSLDSAALSASEGFKWGAFSGVVLGGASETFALKGATMNGLTMNEAAAIQKESKYPLDVIKQLKSVDEYRVYKQAGLRTQTVNGKTALIQDIDLNYIDEVTGKSNLELMKNGFAPVDPKTGYKYELHHINQKPDATLSVLTREQHDADYLHTAVESSEIDRAEFNKIRKEFWQSFVDGVA